MKNMCWRSHKSNPMLISILLVITHIKITILSNKEYIYTSHWHLIESGKYYAPRLCTSNFIFLKMNILVVFTVLGLWLTEEGKGAKYSGVIYRSATFEIILLNKWFLVTLTSDDEVILVTAVWAAVLAEPCCCCPEVTTEVIEVCCCIPLDGDTELIGLCESLLLPALLAEAVCFSSSNIVICVCHICNIYGCYFAISRVSTETSSTTTATRVAHAEARCAYAAGRVEGAAPPRDPPVSSHAFFTWLRVAAAAAALLLEKLYCYCLCAIAENE